MNKKGRISLIVLSVIMFVVAIVAPLAVILMNKNQEGGLSHPDWSVEDNILAENFTFRYRLDSSQNPYYEVVAYKGFDTDVSVPSSFRDVPVKTIAKNAFSGLMRSANTKIVSVNIPTSVTTIGANAFNTCTSLKYVNIHGQTNYFNNAVSLGAKAFAGCKSIENIVVSTNAQLGGSVWLNNTSLREVTVLVDTELSAANVDITKAFAENFANASVTNLTLDKNIQSVEAEAFTDFSSIKTLSIPATCTVGNGAFSNAAITSVTFTTPNGAEDVAITLNTFGNAYNNNVIETVTLSDKITKIDANTFYGFQALKNINLENIKELQNSAFEGCVNLTALNIEKVTTLGEAVFKNCSALTTVTMPVLQTIPNYLFEGCINLTGLTLPENLVNVGTGAFKNVNIANVQISNGFIQDGAFENAHIQNLTISNSASIASNAFSQATFDNVRIYVEEGGKISAQLLAQIFTQNAQGEQSQITTVSITKDGVILQSQKRSSVSNIVNVNNATTNAHVYQLVLDLSVVNLEDEEIQNILKSLTIENLVLLNAPNGEVNDTIAANFTNSGVKHITFGEGVTTIKENAFAENRALESLVEVEFLDDITIEDNAFNGCVNLYKVTFNPEKILIVTGMSFKGTNFTGEKIGDFMVLGSSIIAYLGNEENIVIPSSGVTSISTGAFAGKNITSLQVPAGVQISYGAFDAENNITDVIITSPARGLSNVISYDIMQQFPNIQNLTVQNGVTYTGKALNVAALQKFTIQGNGVILSAWVNTFGNNITKSLEVSGYVTEIESSESYTAWGADLLEVIIGSRVQTIGNNVFAGANNIQTINLDNATVLQNIGDRAFYNNAAITTLKFPSSMQNIGAYAFANATNLATIEGGEGLQSIGDGAFENTAWYTSQNDFVFFGGTLFQYKGSETTLVLGKQINISTEEGVENFVDLKRIATGAFKNNKTLTSVTFTTDEFLLGNNIFEGCTNLLTVTINITDADATWDKNFSNVFAGSSVETLVVGDSTAKIISTVLYNTNIKNLQLHAGLTIPTINSFVSNTQLANVEIRDGGANMVTEDVVRAINNNRAVTNVVLGQNVNIAAQAFSILKTVTSVTLSHAAVTEGLFANSAVTSIVLTNRGSNTIASNVSLINLPMGMTSFETQGITQLGDKVWMGTEDDFPKSSYTIEETIPEGFYAFVSADWQYPMVLGKYVNLENITLDASLTTLGSFVFAWVGMDFENVETEGPRPKENMNWQGLENVNTYAGFAMSGAVVQEMHLNQHTSYAFGSYAFEGLSIHNSVLLFSENATYTHHQAPFNSINYLYTDNTMDICVQGTFTGEGNAFENIIANKVTFGSNFEIKAQMFKGAKLQSINFNGVVAIGANAFQNSNVTNVVTEEDGVWNLLSLQEASVTGLVGTPSDNVQTIKISAALTINAEGWSSGRMFLPDDKHIIVEKTNDVTAVQLAYVVSSLQSLTIGNGLTTYKTSVVSIKYTGDGVVTFPQNDFVIEENGFRFSTCKNFVNTEYITSIGEAAFEECQAENFVFGAGLQTLGASAFKNASKLQSINIPSNIATIEQSAFEGCSSVQTVSIPSVTNIADKAFYGCTSLQSFNSEEVGTLDLSCITGSIGQETFGGTTANTSITQILLPHVQTVGGNAFAMCATAANLIIRNNANIMESSFTTLTQEGASGIINVEVAYEAGQETANVSFLTCLPLTLQSITFAEGIVTLGDIVISEEDYNDIHQEDYKMDDFAPSVMRKYRSLNHVVFPTTLKNIGFGMFAMLYASDTSNGSNIPFKEITFENLESIELQSISQMAFAGINFGEFILSANTNLILVAGAFIGCKYTNITFVGGGVVDDYGAFLGSAPDTLIECVDLTQVQYHMLATKGGGHFSGFTAKEVKLPASVTELPEKAFLDAKISKINLENIITINSYVFARSDHENPFTMDEVNLSSLENFVDTAFMYVNFNHLILGTKTLHISDGGSSGMGYGSTNTVTYRVTGEDTEIDGDSFFDYATNVIIENGITAISRRIGGQNVTLPDANLIAVGDSAFSYGKTLTIQNIENIASIGNGAFSGVAFNAEQHATLNLPNCTSFGSGAFRNAQGFTNVTFGNALTNIGANAFADSSFNSNLDFSSNTTALTIGTNAFKVTAENVQSFKFNNKDITFEAGAFDIQALSIIEIVGVEGYTDLSHITGLDYIKSSTVSQVILSDDITSLQSNAISGGLFEGMTSLTTVVANNIEAVPNNTFKNCTSLQSFTFQNIKYIGNSAFYNCTSLNPTSDGTLDLQNVVALGAQAFYGMKAITSVVFGANLNAEQVEGIEITIGEFDGSTFEGTSVTRYDFSACTALTTLKNFTNNTLVEEVVLSNTMVNIADNTFDGATALQSVNLDAVQNVGVYAFRNTKITSANMPALTSLGQGAFYNCAQLSVVNLPNTITVIPQDAFNTTTSLTSVTLPNQLTTIGVNAFAASGITTVDLPQTVTEIQENAFLGSQMQSLSIYTGATLNVHSTAFNNTQKFTTLTVQYGSKDVLDTNLFNAIVIPQLTTVNIGENITSMEEGLTFSGMSQLTNVTLTSIQTIPEGLFTNTSLQTLKVADGVSMHMGAFDAYTQEAKHYPSISFAQTGANITFVGSGEYTDKMAQCFANKTGLESVTLQGFTSLGNVGQENPLFQGYEIVNLHMPNVQTVGDYAFYQVTVTNVFLPQVTSIGASAFEESAVQGIYEEVAGIAGVVDVPNLAIIGTKAFYNTTLNVLTNRNETIKSLADYAFNVLTQCGTEENALNFAGFTSLGIMELNANKVTFEASMTFNATWQEGVVLTEIAFNNSKTETVDIPMAFVAGVGASVENVTFTGNNMNIPANMFTAFTNPSFTVVNLKSIENVGEGAFANLTNLSTLSVYTHNVIAETAFAGCTNITTLYIDSATADGSLTEAFVNTLHTDLRDAQTLTIGENITQIDGGVTIAESNERNVTYSVLSLFTPTYINVLGVVNISADENGIEEYFNDRNGTIQYTYVWFLSQSLQTIYAPNIVGNLFMATAEGFLGGSPTQDSISVQTLTISGNVQNLILPLSIKTIQTVNSDYDNLNQENYFNIPNVQESWLFAYSASYIPTMYIEQMRVLFVSTETSIDSCIGRIDTINSTLNGEGTYNAQNVESLIILSTSETPTPAENTTVHAPNASYLAVCGVKTVNISNKFSSLGVASVYSNINNALEAVHTVNLVEWNEDTKTMIIPDDNGNGEGVLNLQSLISAEFTYLGSCTSYKMILNNVLQKISINDLIYLTTIEIVGSEYNAPNTYNLENMVSVNLHVPESLVSDVHAYMPNTTNVALNHNGISKVTISSHANLTSNASLPTLTNVAFVGNGMAVQLTKDFVQKIVGNRAAEITELTFSGYNTSIYAADSAENGVFAGFTGITQLNLAGIATVGAYAFANCTSLVKVEAYLHNKLSTNAFVGCTNLTDLTIDSISVYADKIVIENTSANELVLTKDSIDKYFITYDPETNYISTDTSKIKTIELLGGNIVIADAASADLGVFAGMEKLESINISGAIKLGEYAFANSPILANIEGVSGQTIAATAFENCPLLPFDGTSLILANKEAKTAQVYFLGSNKTIDGNYISQLNQRVQTLLDVANAKQHITEMHFVGQNISLQSYNTSFDGYTALKTLTFAENSVTSLPIQAFINCTGLTSVTLPETMHSISSGVFENCTNLKEVYFNSVNCSVSLGGPGTGPFEKCSPDLIVYIGEKVETLGSSLFSSSSLKEIVFAENGALKTIEGSVFDYCYNLTSIIIPDTVESLGQMAFIYCVNLQEVTIGASVKTLMAPFVGCFDLLGANVTIHPENTTFKMQENCIVDITTKTVMQGFADNTLNSESDILAIGDMSFGYCLFNKDFVLPNSVTTIGTYVFAGSNLQKLVLHSNIQTIQPGAFASAYALTMVINQSRLDLSVGSDLYTSTYLTAEVVVASEDEYDITSEGHVLYNNIYITYIGENPEVVIPENITKLGNGAFAFNSTITTLTIPEGVTHIGEATLFGTKNLTKMYYNAVNVQSNLTMYDSSSIFADMGVDTTAVSAEEAYTSVTVHIGNNVEVIPKYTFASCINLNEVVINPESKLNSIQDGAFKGTGINTFIVPSLVTEILYEAFKDCYNLAVIVNYSSLEITKGSTEHGEIARYASEVKNNTDGIVNDGTHIIDTNTNTYLKYIGVENVVNIPEGVISIADNAFLRNQFVQEVIIPSSVTSIGSSAFYTCENLRSIIVPSSVTNIGGNAFTSCTSLTSVTFMEGSALQTIGEYAFSNCSSLTQFTIPASVTSIAKGAFSSCRNLLNIVIPASVTNLDSVAFASCSGLTTVTFANGTALQTISESIFSGCVNLTNIVIPASVVSIDQDAFYRCSSLTTVTFANGSALKTIGKSAFYACTSLTSIIIPSGVISIGNGAFISCTNLTSVTFENPNGWFVTTDSSSTSGTNVTLTDPAQNATYFKSTYSNYYWKKTA